jgi:tetratricopeptide (TPR) repeat protein
MSNGELFVGRRRFLDGLKTWSQMERPGLALLVGQAGAGKSALLRAATSQMADALIINAVGDSSQALMSAIAVRLGLPADAQPDVIDAALSDQTRVTVVYDASHVLEPALGAEIATLLVRLANRAPVIAAIRPRDLSESDDLPRQVGSDVPIWDLDDDADTQQDIETYLIHRLTGTNIDAASTARALAARAVHAGGGGFRFARMVADRLLVDPNLTGPPDLNADLTTVIRDGFLDEVERLAHGAGADAGRIVHLFTTLACLLADAVPAESIAALATSPDLGLRFTVEEVKSLVGEFDALLTRDEYCGLPAYRSFHREVDRALAERQRDTSALDEHVCRLLLEQSDQGRRPAGVDPYIAREAYAHAARLGQAGVQLFRDLAAANPTVYRPPLAKALSQWALRLDLSAQRHDAIGLVEEGINILRQVVAAGGDDCREDLVGCLDQLGHYMAQDGRLEEALALTQESADLSRRLAEQDPPRLLDSLATVLNTLAIRLAAVGRDEAVLAAREAVSIRRVLTAHDPMLAPDLAMALSTLSIRLSESGQRAEATALAEESVRLRRALAAIDPTSYRPVLASGLHNLAGRLAEAGDSAAALNCLDEAIGIRRDLADTDPDAHRADLAMSYANYVAILTERGELVGAVQLGHEAITILCELVEADPGPHEVELARMLHNQCRATAQLGELSQAIALGSEAIVHLRRLAVAAPPVFLPQLASTSETVAGCLGLAGEFDRALPLVEQAATIYAAFAESERDPYLAKLASVLSVKAACLVDVGRPRAALLPLQGIVAIRRLLAMDSDMQSQTALAQALCDLASRMGALNVPSGALSEAEQAVQIYRAINGRGDPEQGDLANALVVLAEQLARSGRGAEAVAAAREALDLGRASLLRDPEAGIRNVAVACHALASRLVGVGHHAHAVPLLEECVSIARTNPEFSRRDLAGVLAELSRALLKVERVADALAAAHEATNLHLQLRTTMPYLDVADMNDALTAFAEVLHASGRADEAAREFDGALSATGSAQNRALLLLGRSLAPASLSFQERVDGAFTAMQLLAGQSPDPLILLDARSSVRRLRSADPTSFDDQWMQHQDQRPSWLTIPHGLVEVVASWCACESWAASRAFLNVHPEIASDAGQAAVVEILDANADNTHVQRVRYLLSQIRSIGPSDAYAPLLAEELLEAWLNRPSWVDSAAFLRDHPDLLDPPCLAAMADRAKRMPLDGSTVAHHAILDLARAGDAERGFAYLQTDDPALRQALRMDSLNDAPVLSAFSSLVRATARSRQETADGLLMAASADAMSEGDDVNDLVQAAAPFMTDQDKRLWMTELTRVSGQRPKMQAACATVVALLTALNPGRLDTASSTSAPELDAVRAWAARAIAAAPVSARYLLWLMIRIDPSARTVVTAQDCWCRLASPSPDRHQPDDFDAGLEQLVAAALLAVESGAPDESARILIHPAVAERANVLAEPGLLVAIETAIANHYLDRVEQDPADLTSIMAALPYLLRLEQWDPAIALLQRLLEQDNSPHSAATAAAHLRTVATATRQPEHVAMFVQALAFIDLDEAIDALRAWPTDADAMDEQGRLLLSELLYGLLVQAGRSPEAMSIVEQIDHITAEAAFGPWTVALNRGRRLQLMAQLGDAAQAIIDIEALLAEMASLPQTDTPSDPTDAATVLEVLYNAGAIASRETGDWRQALDFNAGLVAVLHQMGASEGEVVWHRYNDCYPLLQLNRLDEAEELLTQCQAISAHVHDQLWQGKVGCSWAALRAVQGRLGDAIGVCSDALRLVYALNGFQQAAVCHDDIALYMVQADVDPPGRIGNRLAAAIIRHLLGLHRARNETVARLAHDLPDVPEAVIPGSIQDVHTLVERTVGVSFTGLILGIGPFAAGCEAMASVMAEARALSAVVVNVRDHLDRWEPSIAGVVAAAGGDQRARAAVDAMLDDIAETEDWAALTRALRRVLAGERGFEALTNGLDNVDTAVVRRTLDVLAGRAALTATADEILAHYSEPRVMLPEFLAAVSGESAARSKVEASLTKLSEQVARRPMAHALRAILQGDREYARLRAGVDESDAEIIEVILAELGDDLGQPDDAAPEAEPAFSGLWADLAARAAAFDEQRDTSAVLDPAVPARITDLLSLVTGEDGAVPDDVANLVAHLFLFRYLARDVDGSTHDDDLAAATRWFAALADGDGFSDDELPLRLCADAAFRGATLLDEALSIPDIPVLDMAIELLRAGVSQPTDDPVTYSGRLGNLATALSLRFEWLSDIESLTEACRYGEQAVAVAPPHHPDRGNLLSALGLALRLQFETHGDVADLKRALAAHREAAVSPTADGSARAVCLNNLSIAERVMFEVTDDAECLDRSVDAGRAAIAALPAMDPRVAVWSTNLAAALTTRFRELKTPADLDEAETLARTAAQAEPAAGAALTNLASVLFAKFQARGDQCDLSEVIAIDRAALAATPAGHTERSNALGNLAVALFTRHEAGGPVADVNEAIELAGLAVDEAAPGQPSRARWLFELARMHSLRFRESDIRSDLDRALAHGRAAMDATPPNHREHAERTDWLISTYMDGAFRQGDNSLLDDAIALVRVRLAGLDPGHTDRAERLRLLNQALRRRYERQASLRDLDEAVDVARIAYAEATTDGDRLRGQATLAETLSNRFAATGDAADVEEAVSASRAATTEAIVDGTDAELEHALGAALAIRFRRSGNLADLQEAIALGRSAVATSPADDGRRPIYLSDLCQWVRNRYEQTGDSGDIDEAVALGREAINANMTGLHDIAGFQSSLATALWVRYVTQDAWADIDEAVTLLQSATAATPRSHAHAATRWSNLGRALATRAHARPAGTYEAVCDIYEAVGAGRSALVASPEGDAERLRWMSNLSLALQDRFRVADSFQDLVEAITIASTIAGATPHDHPETSARLLYLAQAHARRFHVFNEPDDAHNAIDFFRQAAAGTSGPTAIRARAAQQLGQLAAELARWPTAVDGFAAAVQLMPLTAWHGVNEASRRTLLEQWDGLACEAASCAVTAGQLAQTLQLLEHGRAVLWSHLLDTRTDLDSLQQRECSIATRLRQIRNELDAATQAEFVPTS